MWLIFALFVFSYLFGIVGTLVAVPVAAALGVVVRFALRAFISESSGLVRGDATATGGRPSGGLRMT